MTQVCIAYYSRTGRTKALCEELSKRLERASLRASLHVIKPVREYGEPLYLNPRVVLDALRSRDVDIVVEPPISINECRVIIVAGPVWFGRAAPPLRTFVKRYLKRYEGDVVLVLTSRFGKDYSRRFAEYIGVKPRLSLDIAEQSIREDIDAVLKPILSVLSKRKRVGEEDQAYS